MALKFSMTWFKDRRCWYGKHGGKRYYCPIKCESKTGDMDGYRASLDWWNAKRKELAAVPVVSSASPKLTAEERKFVKQLMNESARPRTEEESISLVRGWNEMQADIDVYGPSDYTRWAAMERQRKEKEAATVHTMEALVTKFLRFKVNQTVTGMKSAGRAINLVTYMKPFKAFVGPEKPVSSITEMTLFDYHSKSIQLLNAGEISDFGARDRMQVAKQFIRWAWELGLLELPRNINSKELTIYVEQKEIRIFDFAKLKSLVDGAPEPLKVYLLLMANCGMTAMDVGDLQHAEFNAKDGTITRVRSKRKKRKGGSAGAEGSKLKITWKLWPVTIELIKKLRSKDKQFVFTSQDGNPVAYTKIDAATFKGCDVDVIDKAYRAYCKRLKISKSGMRPLKAIRATSASKIGEHPEYARYAQYFLGQSPRSVAEKYYVKPSQEQFNRCVHWLGQQYGFVPEDESTA